MRRRGTLDENEAAIEFVPATLLEPLRFSEVFTRDAPVQIDVGCGDGTFLVALALENPRHNFLGLERLAGRMRSVCRKAARLQLTNVRVLRIDATYALEQLIPGDSVETVHVLFPDPWPKRRHHRRRTFDADFVRAIHRLLAPNARLHIATDHAEYFECIRHLVSGGALFKIDHTPEAFPRSRFEERFAAAGVPIHQLLLRKISPVR